MWFRVNSLQGLADVGAIYIGDEVETDVRGHVRRQGDGHHFRAQIGAANADIDYIGDTFSGVAPPFARPHSLAEPGHLRQNPIDLRHHVLAIDENGSVGAIAQCDMQHSSILGRVDLFAAEHRLDGCRKIGLSSKIVQQFHRFGGDAIFGIIK